MMSVVLQMVVTAGVLACLAGVAIRAFRPAPAVCHALWLVVLLKLLVPPVVHWPWPIPVPSFGFNDGAMLQVPTPTSDLPKADLSLLGRSPIAPQSAPDDLAGESSEARATGLVAFVRAAAPYAERGACLMWALGGAAIALLHVVRAFRFSRRLREAAPPPEWLADAARDIASRMGVACPRILVLDGVPSPLLLGLGRARLVMPAALLNLIDRTRWHCVLAHELAHLKRRDHLVRLVEGVAGCIWWWNPILWMARRRLRETAELACDAWVVHTLPENRRTYAETLIDVSEIVSRAVPPLAALGMGAGVRMDFERRLTMILRENAVPRLTLRHALPVLALLLAALPGWPQATQGVQSPEAKPAEAPAPQPAAAETALTAPTALSPVQKALDKPLSINFGEVPTHIQEITDFIGEYLNVNIVLDYRVVEPDRAAAIPRICRQIAGVLFKPCPSGEVTPAIEGNSRATSGIVSQAVNLQDTPAATILKSLLAPLNLTYSIQPGYVWITTPQVAEKEGAIPRRARADRGATQEVVGKSYTVAFPADRHVAVIAMELEKQWGIPFVVDARVIGPPPDPAQTTTYLIPISPEDLKPPPLDPEIANSYVTDGMVQYIKLENVPLRDVLTALVRPLNLGYAVQPGFIWISTADRVAREDFSDPDLGTQEDIRSKLEELVSLDFGDVPTDIREILDFVSEYRGINIVVDSRALPPVPGPPPPGSDPLLPRGAHRIKQDGRIVLTGIVPGIKVQDLPAKDALKALLIPLDLWYKVGPGFVFVSSRELLAQTSFEPAAPAAP